MTIAPNGVAVADYDPEGIGSIVFAAIYRTEYQGNLQFGDVVDAAVVKLRPACIHDNATEPGDNITLLTVSANPLPGSWKCLGLIHLENVNVSESATLFMRVA